MRVGTDEAGKGPVLGSMFAAAVGVPDAEVLPDDVGDSKGIDPKRRRTITTRLAEDDRIAVGVAEITVDRIDDPDTDMNSLTVTAHAEAIDEAVGASEAPDVTVLADAGDTSEERFGRRVADACKPSVAVTAEHGADETDPVVGAASIVAKVRRDEHVRGLAERYDRPIGSGYPSDPTTREFLETYADEHGDVPPCTRRSWSTVADVLATVEQSGLGEFR